MAKTTTDKQEPQRELRELDKKLGQLYRNDPSVHHIPFLEYKKQWQQAQKLRKMKTRYSLFEPIPNESPLEFKKRTRTITLDIPIETIEEYNARVDKLFGGGI